MQEWFWQIKIVSRFKVYFYWCVTLCNLSLGLALSSSTWSFVFILSRSILKVSYHYCPHRWVPNSRSIGLGPSPALFVLSLSIMDRGSTPCLLSLCNYPFFFFSKVFSIFSSTKKEEKKKTTRSLLELIKSCIVPYGEKRLLGPA